MADIFKELQTMVIDQGTVLDRIDYNIETTTVHVQEAHAQLKKVCFIRGFYVMWGIIESNIIYNQAEHYQDKTKGKLCIILLCLVICVMILILIAKLRRW